MGGFIHIYLALAVVLELIRGIPTTEWFVPVNRIRASSNDTKLEVRNILSEPNMNAAISRTKGLPTPDTDLDLGGLLGLSEDDARARLQHEGPNELPTQTKRNLFTIVLEVAREPMFLMLIAAGSLYLLMGEPADALMLLGFVFVVMAITIVQERRTERSLEALRDLSSPRALVIREGVSRRIPGREVVRGDILSLAEGDRVPADAILRRGINLSVDESLLTGESAPVGKAASNTGSDLERPGGDDLFSLFSGTLVTAGQGVVEVVSTGVRSELGKIGKALQQIEPEATLLQKDTGRMVRMFALVGIAASIVVILAYAYTRGGGATVWKQGLLAGITMAMSLLPEEIPVILTIFLALGAWRISRNRVLTRRMPAIETLGKTTVLCVDKTGTLTLNRMTLKHVVAGSHSMLVTAETSQLPEELNALLEHAILASARDPFDPMEKALHVAGGGLLRQTDQLHADWSLVRAYPLSPGLSAVSQVWRRGPNDEFIIASKGAPEAIAKLCRMSVEGREAMGQQVKAMASEGLRVLGVARGTLKGDKLPDIHADLALDFVGLLGFEDPLRPDVPAAVTECQTAGIRVIMITGDYPVTAQCIARQAGLANFENIITGPELEKLSDQDLATHAKRVGVFARVLPEQKLRIVNALKANQEVVAMTGDGVNDAPALKSSHIGIAMGGRGTDVAREAADLVLLDDDFTSIVAAIRLGRRIYDNIRKAVAFTFAVHVPIAGLSLLPVFFAGWPLLLLPTHIVFLELIIDPSCSLVFEAEADEENVMKRPPRGLKDRLFSLDTVGLAVLQGLSMLAVCIGVFLFAKQSHTSEAARALTFCTLVVAVLAVLLANRSSVVTIFTGLRMPNIALWFVVGGTVLFLPLVLLLPFAQKLFRFAPLHTVDLVLCIAAGFACAIWFDLLKLSKRWTVAHQAAANLRAIRA
jgi:Ca2+-transporting ATPase